MTHSPKEIRELIGDLRESVFSPLQISAAIALEHLLQFVEWRPIEDAPKTTRARLVHCQERENTYCVTWDEQEQCWQFFGGIGRLKSETPTHFVALPPPPEEEEEERW